jgi:autotransporter passenger strand-loop-strand repeat protein
MSLNESAPTTIHTHSGGSSTLSGNIVTSLAADQAGDGVLGTAVLAGGAEVVITAAVDNNVPYNSLTYAGYTSLSLTIIDNGAPTTTTLSLVSGADFLERETSADDLQVTALTNGNFVVAETTVDDNVGPVNPNLYYEVFNSAGGIVKSWTQVNASGSDASENDVYTLTSTPNGGFAIQWGTNDETNGFFQRFDSNGASTGSAQNYLNVSTGGIFAGGFAVDTAGDVIIAIPSPNENVYQPNLFTIYNSSNVAIVSNETFQTAEGQGPGGTPLLPEIVNSNFQSPYVSPVEAESSPDFQALPSGGFVAIITDPTGPWGSNGYPDIDYYLQRITVSGGTATFDTPVLVGDNLPTSMVVLADGNILLDINGAFEILSGSQLPSANTGMASATPVALTPLFSGSLSPSGVSIVSVAADNNGGVFAALQSGLVTQYYGTLDANLFAADFTNGVTVTPPVVTAGATATFHGGNSPVSLDSGVTVTDSSSPTLASATVKIATGFLSGDTLNFDNQNGITGSYVNGTLTLSGTASVADYQAALDSITYGFTLGGDPTGGSGDTTRTIDWTVNDGTLSSTTATSTIDVTHTAPTVTAAGTVTFVAGGTPVALDSTLTASDPDSGGNLTSARVSIGTGFANGDILNFTAQNGISGAYNGSTGVLILTGSASVTNYKTALDSITFSTTATSASARTISYSVNDGVAASSTATSTVDVHVRPVVTAGATATFAGGGAAQALDSALTVSDSSSSTLLSATVSIQTGLLSGDTLNFTNQNGIAGSYDSATGVLTLTGSASVANYQTALDSITYSFATPDGDPTNGGGDTSRTIGWVVNDGTVNSTAATSTLHTTHTAPTITAGATANFIGGGGPTTLDGAVAVGDVDSNGDLAGATVSIGAGFLTGDTLNFSGQNGISGNYDSSTGVLTLTGSSSVVNYQTALASVTYSFTPTDGDPTEGGSDTSRTINWAVNDGTSNSTTTTSTLDTTHVAPTITAGAIASFTGGGGPTTLDSAAVVGDVDSNGNLASATVSISSGFITGDTLNFTNQNGITGSYDSATGVLTLTGSASVANYQTALDSIAYGFTPTNGDPTGGGADTSRTIDWVVNDGTSNSTTATSTLDTMHVAPTITAGATASFTAGGAPATLDSAATVGDVDSNGQLARATVAITTGFISGDTLNFANQNGITGSYDGATGVLTLSGAASLANYQTALESVSYSFTPGGDPTVGGADTSRTVSWVVNDGVADSTVATSMVDTAQAKPTLTGLAPSLSYPVQGAPIALSPSATLSDGDDAELTGATVSVTGGAFAGDGDVLTAVVAGTAITATYDAATETLALSGTDTLADYQAVLRSVALVSTAGDPTNGGANLSRTIAWQATDTNGETGLAENETVNIVEVASAGATTSNVILYPGASETVLAGGTASATTVVSGSDQVILSGGAAVGTNVSSGGGEYIYSGGVASGGTISRGGSEFVESNGVASGANVDGGAQVVYGAANGTTLNSGGFQYVESGGTASGTTINSGAQVVLGAADGATVNSGGADYVESGGVASGTKVSGGDEYVESGGAANGVNVTGGAQVVYGAADGVTLASGGFQYVEAGGTASGTTVNGGGVATVFGLLVGATDNSGGAEYVNFGGVASGTTISGGTEFIEIGGVASGDQVDGGAQVVYGTAVGATINSGGFEYVEAGGATSGTTVDAGGIETIFGRAVSTTDNSGGFDYVYSGGAASATQISGGDEYVEVGGTATGTHVSGGAQVVYGAAAGTTLASGGIQDVFSGGVASSTSIDSGGYEYVAAGGAVSGATISGGTLELTAGAIDGGAPITFATSGGGTLRLDDAAVFGGLIAGFGEPDLIDLSDVVYRATSIPLEQKTSVTFTEAANNTSGTLTVTDGLHTANLTLLGQYVTAQFTLASDGHGGTFVGDPPLTAMTDPSPETLVASRPA